MRCLIAVNCEAALADLCHTAIAMNALQMHTSYVPQVIQPVVRVVRMIRSDPAGSDHDVYYVDPTSPVPMAERRFRFACSYLVHLLLRKPPVVLHLNRAYIPPVGCVGVAFNRRRHALFLAPCEKDRPHPPLAELNQSLTITMAYHDYSREDRSPLPRHARPTVT